MTRYGTARRSFRSVVVGPRIYVRDVDKVLLRQLVRRTVTAPRKSSRLGRVTPISDGFRAPRRW